MEFKCQICESSCESMFDACSICGWENEDTLSIDDEKSIYVQCSLKPDEWSYYSYANRCTPISHKTKHLASRANRE